MDVNFIDHTYKLFLEAAANAEDALVKKIERAQYLTERENKRLDRNNVIKPIIRRQTIDSITSRDYWLNEYSGDYQHWKGEQQRLESVLNGMYIYTKLKETYGRS